MGILKVTAHSMKVRKLTDWFPGDVKPARKGIYQRDYGIDSIEDYWSGRVWRYAENGTVCLSQNRPWRGLAEKR